MQIKFLYEFKNTHLYALMETKHEALKMFLTRILWNMLFSIKERKI